jgi:hypothetical protein
MRPIGRVTTATSNIIPSSRASYVEQHLAYVGGAIRCCPSVPDNVKVDAKQITEAKAAAKLLKKQSAAIVTKGSKAKLVAELRAMHGHWLVSGCT